MESNQVEESFDQLLEAQVRVLKYAEGFVNSPSLSCAIRLGMFEAIHQHGKAMTLSELATSLRINPRKVHGINSLVRLLTFYGFLLEENTITTTKISQLCQSTPAQQISAQLQHFQTGPKRYGLTTTSRLLLKDATYSIKPCALLGDIDALAKKPLDSLGDWLLNDDASAFETAHGKSLWEFSASDEGFSVPFNEGMASESKLVSDVVVKECKDVFTGLTSLVDVGGGTGTVTKAIALAFPGTMCTVFDLPHVVGDLVGTAENLEFVGGDMFDVIPPANAILLKWVLHNWDDENCVKILRKCKEAIPSKENGGKVIIIDMIMDNQDDDKEIVEAQILFDMLMMVLFAGKERNLKQWSEIFSEAGFSDYKIVRKLGGKSLIEVYP